MFDRRENTNKHLVTHSGTWWRGLLRYRTYYDHFRVTLVYAVSVDRFTSSVTRGYDAYCHHDDPPRRLGAEVTIAATHG